MERIGPNSNLNILRKALALAAVVGLLFMASQSLWAQELTTRTVEVTRHPACAFVDTAETFLSQDGNVRCDNRSKTLEITDYPYVVEEISHLLSQLDDRETRCRVNLGLVILNPKSEPKWEKLSKIWDWAPLKNGSDLPWAVSRDLMVIDTGWASLKHSKASLSTNWFHSFALQHKLIRTTTVFSLTWASLKIRVSQAETPDRFEVVVMPRVLYHTGAYEDRFEAPVEAASFTVESGQTYVLRPKDRSLAQRVCNDFFPKKVESAALILKLEKD